MWMLIVLHAVIGILVGVYLARTRKRFPEDYRPRWAAIVLWTVAWLPLLVVAMVAVTVDVAIDLWRHQ